MAVKIVKRNVASLYKFTRGKWKDGRNRAVRISKL